jgi:hypothetical protein
MNRIAPSALACLIAIAIVAAIASPALAHHSAAAYNTQQNISVTGPIKVYNFKNPHVTLFIEVKKADGTTSLMEVEAGAASVLSPLGFNKDSVKVGEIVTIAGNPSRNAPDKEMLGKDLTKADGSYIPLNISSRSVYASTGGSATTIAGTWFSPMRSFTGFLGGARGWPTNEKARAAAVNDPKATTQKDCIPIGVPAMMFYPVATTIKVERDRVVMDIDWMDSERTIYLDGRKHPPATETSLLGHSVGRFEGTALIVETTNFKEHPMGLSQTVPSSTQKKLTEKFALGPDGKTLIYSGTIEDPVYLNGPIPWSGSWEYRPGMPHSNQKCDVEVARRFLTQ